VEDGNETEKAGVAPKKSRRRSFDALKIRRALDEELAETGTTLPAFLLLEPAEKTARLAARMRKSWRYQDAEIPKPRAIAAFFAPLEQAES
jgi:hypothetical protein